MLPQDPRCHRASRRHPLRHRTARALAPEHRALVAPPAAATRALATARWDTHRCPECRHWQARLVASRALSPGDALTVEDDGSLPYPPPGGPPAFTLSFDGSYSRGAAAILRRQARHGKQRVHGNGMLPCRVLPLHPGSQLPAARGASMPAVSAQ